MTLSETIVDIMEEDYFMTLNIEEHDKEKYIAIIKYDPAGLEVDDIVISIFFDGTNGSFVKSLREYIDSFDKNKQIVSWLKELEKKGIRESVREVEKEVEELMKKLQSMMEEIEDLLTFIC